MRLRYLFLMIGLVCYASLWGQQAGQDQKEQQEQTQRPTLGPPPAPSLHGLRTFSTTDPRKLIRIRTIFVDHIENSLSEKLADGLSRMGRFRIVASRKDADAVLRGLCVDLRRLRTVHSEVFLNDRSSGASIWQDNIRMSYNPPPLPKVVDNTAVAILQHLGDSVAEAERKD